MSEPEIRPAGEFAGAPDGFGRLWMPHRMAYIQGENKPASGSAGEECPFCRIPTGDDDAGLIVARGSEVYAVLNLYPYNTGHLLVVPYRHVADYPELTDAETAELAAFTQAAMRAIRAAMGPQGFNIGINQGEAGGAGIAAHLHQHIVPRWIGDTNFVPVVARTRVLPQLLADTRALLAQAWDSGVGREPLRDGAAGDTSAGDSGADREPLRNGAAGDTSAGDSGADREPLRDWAAGDTSAGDGAAGDAPARDTQAGDPGAVGE